MGDWNLRFIWNLVLEIWNFRSLGGTLQIISSVQSNSRLISPNFLPLCFINPHPHAHVDLPAQRIDSIQSRFGQQGIVQHPFVL